jgi:hypothetical protein
MRKTEACLRLLVATRKLRDAKARLILITYSFAEGTVEDYSVM